MRFPSGRPFHENVSHESEPILARISKLLQYIPKSRRQRACTAALCSMIFSDLWDRQVSPHSKIHRISTDLHQPTLSQSPLNSVAATDFPCYVGVSLYSATLRSGLGVSQKNRFARAISCLRTLNASASAPSTPRGASSSTGNKCSPVSSSSSNPTHPILPTPDTRIPRPRFVHSTMRET